MKKHSLFKVLLIILGLLVVTSYVVVGREGALTYLAIGDVGVNFVQAFYYFFDTIVFLLVLGAFYGVLNLVPGYKKLLDNVVSKVKSHSKLFVFVTTCVFALLTSVTGLINPILVFVPFVISIILILGYDKLVAISSTIVAMLVGFMGGLFITFRDASNYYGYSSTTFEKLAGIGDYANLWPKLILLVLGTLLLIFFINKHIKDVEDKKVKYELNNSDEVIVSEVKGDYKNIKTWPLITVLSLIFVILVLGYFPWNSLFGIECFDKFHESFLKVGFSIRHIFMAIDVILLVAIVIKSLVNKKFNIKDWSLNPLFVVILLIIVLSYLPFGFLDNFQAAFNAKNITFANIISGNLYSFGNWAALGSSMAIILILLVATLIIKFIYRVNFDNVIDSFADGFKKMVPTVILVALSFAILICTVNNGFISTIITSLADGKLGLNVATVSLVTALGSLLHVDLYYTISGVLSPILSSATDESLYATYALTFQSIYGLVSIIGPTSFLLIVVLTYFDVPYTTWIKYIWRFVLALLLLVILVLIVLSLI